MIVVSKTDSSQACISGLHPPQSVGESVSLVEKYVLVIVGEATVNSATSSIVSILLRSFDAASFVE